MIISRIVNLILITFHAHNLTLCHLSPQNVQKSIFTYLLIYMLFYATLQQVTYRYEFTYAIKVIYVIFSLYFLRYGSSPFFSFSSIYVK